MPERRRPLRCGVGVAVLGGVVAALAWLVPGTSGAYTASVRNSDDSVRTAESYRCADAFAASREHADAYFEYAFGEAAAQTAAQDSSAADDPGLYQNGHAVDSVSPMACPNDTPEAALELDGTSQFVATTKSTGSPPDVFSLVVWFKTSSAQGRIVGLSSDQLAATGPYDRHVYFGDDGRLRFGTYSDGFQILTTPPGTNYADGAWHLVVATMADSGPATGMRLFVDGTLVASNPAYAHAEPTTGYWRIGYYPMSGGWGQAASSYFRGSMRFAAAYRFVLTPAEVAARWETGRPG